MGTCVLLHLELFYVFFFCRNLQERISSSKKDLEKVQRNRKSKKFTRGGVLLFRNCDKVQNRDVYNVKRLLYSTNLYVEPV